MKLNNRHMKLYFYTLFYKSPRSWCNIYFANPIVLLSMNIINISTVVLDVSPDTKCDMLQQGHTWVPDESQNDCIWTTPTLPFSPDLANRNVMWEKNQRDMISIMIKILGLKEYVERMWQCQIGSDLCQIFSDTFSWIHF